MRKFSIQHLTKQQKELRKRILEISFKNNLSHIGSCLTAVDIIYTVYKKKKKDELFVLSNGHAGVSLYSVLERFGYIKDKKISEKLHVHPDRNPSLGIHVSSGSLGQAFSIALGMGLANKKKTVYCMVSDGECTEGSIWEALHTATTYAVKNVILFVNANGWGAYSQINLKLLKSKLRGFGVSLIEIDGHNEKEISNAITKKVKNFKVIFSYTTPNQLPFLQNQDAHYYQMTQDDYKTAINLLS